MSCIPCQASSTLNPAISKFLSPGGSTVGLSVPAGESPGTSTSNPYKGYMFPCGSTDNYPAYQTDNPNGGYGAQQNCPNDLKGPQAVYSQRFVSPTLRCGSTDLTNAGQEPSQPLCPNNKCGSDFGFIGSDSRNLAVTAQQAAVDHLTIGTSLRLSKACAPLLTPNPPAIFPLGCPPDLSCKTEEGKIECLDKYNYDIFYTLNSVIARLQEVGLMATFTASRGHSMFRAIGRQNEPGLTQHNPDGTTTVLDHMWPNSNRFLYNPPANKNVTCRVAPQICLYDAYDFIQYLQGCIQTLQGDPPSPENTIQINSMEQQLVCLRNMVSRWQESFGNVSCIDERTFVNWFEGNCYACY